MTGGIAWVFPGQGSQEVGMGRDLYEGYASARDLYDRADAILGRPISQLCFDGPAAELNQTVNAQPAIYVTSLAMLDVALGIGALAGDPLFVAGHSLGEYSALSAAGALEFEAGLRLVEERGRLTQGAADATPGGMAAILGLEEAQVQAICDETGAELCNINSPGQIVIGGKSAQLDRACEVAIERGARRAVPLEVSGAFHTSVMEPAVGAMTDAVRTAALATPNIPFVANNTAAPVQDPVAIGEGLVYQLTHPVRWVQCVQYMVAAGAVEFIEIGPGRVLSGLVKRIAPETRQRNLNGVPSITR